MGKQTTYLSIKRVLVESWPGWKTAKQIADGMGLSESTIKGYLREMRLENLIDRRRYYSGRSYVFVYRAWGDWVGEAILQRSFREREGA